MTMAEQSGPATTQAALKEVSFTRVYDAPCEVVFDAWTDPEQVTQWWGPDQFTIPFVDMDVRPGGAFRIDMKGPEGTPYSGIYPNVGTFEEVVRPSRLVMKEGALFPGDDSPGIEARTTVTFEPQGDKTKVTVHSVVLKSKPQYADALSGMEGGWKQQLDKLTAYLAKRSR
jgi:uncharacterized protein YndB with AHSA1/START domain